MKAEIICSGTEILLGEIVDTNSSFIAGQLPSLGIDLYFVSVVGDNRGRLLEVLRRAWDRADLIITTGGLGPTQDDITREAIAELLGEELKVDSTLWRELEGFFARHHREIPASNVRQAMVTDSVQVIRNPQGTAPGWWIEKDGHIVVAMPGPPEELQFMWTDSVLPALMEKGTGAVILSRTIKIFGLPEAQVDELVAPFLQSPNPTLATYVRSDGVYLRIAAKASERAEAQQMIAQREVDIRRVLGDHIWGVDGDTLGSAVGALLKARQLSLAVMESYTDGLLSDTIAGATEGLSCFRGGLVACSEEAMVAFGLDSRLTGSRLAEAMAGAARHKLGADVGIGIAGEGGNIFIGLDCNGFKRSITRSYIGERLRIKQRAINATLFELRRILLEEA
jgi:nicotinamide-nucleotide amidase